MFYGSHQELVRTPPVWRSHVRLMISIVWTAKTDREIVLDPWLGLCGGEGHLVPRGVGSGEMVEIRGSALAQEC